MRGSSRVFIPGAPDLPWKRPDEPRWAGFERDRLKQKIVQRLAMTDRMRKMKLTQYDIDEFLEILGLSDDWFPPKIIRGIKLTETRRNNRKKR